MTMQVFLFSITFALVFYTLGATFIEGFVNYRSWQWIGAGEFKQYHRSIKRPILGFVVLPFAMSLIFTFALVWSHPASIPGWSLWASISLDLIAGVVSIAYQVPIQLELDRNGLMIERLRRLISMEWLRNATHIGNAVLFLWMMIQVINR